ncbi:MAG: imidazolonepropionase [bacterium]|nr:imidazolonepropionase [bacterium]
MKLLRNCSQLVTCSNDDSQPKTGEKMSHLELIEQGALVFEGETIKWVGIESDVTAAFPKARFEEVIDANGMLVTPGLVDPHTHPVFAATREDEFYMRNAGKTYMEIAEAGGGIRNSARRLRQADEGTLYNNGIRFLNRMLKSGTTTAEAKSGYGLSTESEVKSLEVIQRLDKNHPIDLVPTFLGAHEFPDEYRSDREGYVRLLIEEMIPLVAKRNLAKYCDIFTEAGVFDIDQSRRIMSAAKQNGFELKFHADELKSVGGAELAAELGAVSADHLVYASDNGIAAMAKAKTIAVFLPSTTFFLGHKEYAPARKMLTAGVPVALATDFNPGSSCNTSLQATMTIAAIYLKMTPEEILNAVTFNSACAIGMQEKVGSLQIGKLADFVLWDAENYKQLPYFFAQNPVTAVYKRGQKVV